MIAGLLKFTALSVCTVDCVWGPWRSWSQCSALCGGGTRTSSRGKSEARNGGKPCVGSATHTEECNAQPCPGGATATRYMYQP